MNKLKNNFIIELEGNINHKNFFLMELCFYIFAPVFVKKKKEICRILKI